MITVEVVHTALEGIVDPCSAATGVPLSILDMGLLSGVEIRGDQVLVDLRLTSPLCHQAPYFIMEVEQRIGALAGALMIAALGPFKFRGKLLTLGSFVFPVLVLIFALVRWLPLSLLALAGAGWGFMILFNLANTLIQTLVPDELRGRVVSIYTLSFFGLMPLGALLAGWVAEFVGEPTTIVLSALISLV